MIKKEAVTVATRFIAYCGVSITAVIVPLLIFKVTGSLALAGIALVVEWTPKFGFYLFGGQLVERFGAHRAIVAADAFRAAASAGLLVCAAVEPSFFIIAALAAVSQSANAVSNIIFEAAVKSAWAPTRQTQGHAALGRADLLSGVIALPLVAMLPMEAMGAAAVACFSLAAAINATFGRGVFSDIHPVGRQTPWRREFGIFTANLGLLLKSAKLRTVAIFGLIVGLPGALVGSAPSFFLAQANASVADDHQFISTVIAVKSALAFILLGAISSLLDKGTIKERPLFATAFLTFLAGLATLGASKGSMTLFLSGYAAIHLGWYAMIPLLRKSRQGAIPDGTRSSMTGVLISVEALSYLVAAAFAAAYSGNPLLFVWPVMAVSTLALVAMARAGIVKGMSSH